MPALFAGYPLASPPVLLGTNKLGSICGTAGAMFRYLRVVNIPWRVLLPAAAMAFLASLSGASLVSAVSPGLFRPLVPVMLIAVLAYVLWHKDLGARHAPIVFSRRRGYFALAFIGAIGLYDGFFGPGTGSFLMLLFIRLYGFDFLHASAGARAINVATNAGALMFFGFHGEIHWALGLTLGICNAMGSVLGAHTALKHGGRFIRVIFIAVVVALIAKTGHDALGLIALPVSRPGAPAITLPHPLVGNPMVSWSGRHPVTGHPFMAPSDPAPIATQPFISRRWSCPNDLDPRRGWRDHHHAIGIVTLVRDDHAGREGQQQHDAGRPMRI